MHQVDYHRKHPLSLTENQSNYVFELLCSGVCKTLWFRLELTMVPEK